MLGIVHCLVKFKIISNEQLCHQVRLISFNYIRIFTGFGLKRDHLQKMLNRKEVLYNYKGQLFINSTPDWAELSTFNLKTEADFRLRCPKRCVLKYMNRTVS
jgi:hypothetical protein